MGGGGVSVPAPSAEERELQRQQALLLAEQRDMITRQNEQNAILLPFLAEMEGFDVTVNDKGMLTSISKRPDPLEDQNKEITRLFNERSMAALKGELPVDPALERALAGEEENIRNRLASQFGPGYETSSPGIETLANFFSTAEGLREGARTGQLTLAEQLGLTRQQQDIFARGSSQDVLRTSAVADPLAFAGAFGQVARGYGQAQVPYIQNRQLITQANMANAQQQTALLGAGIGAIGAYFSTKEVKAAPDGELEMVLVSYTKHGLPIYKYKRIDTGEEHIGVLSEDVEEVFPGAVYSRGGYDMVQYRSLE